MSELEEVARRLGREVLIEGDDDARDELLAGAVHPERGWLAWVVNTERPVGKGVLDCSLRLQARTEGEGLALDWELETYNPYFGCGVRHLAWYGERLVVIYREKHETYAACLSPGDGLRRLVELDREWSLAGGLLLSGGRRLTLPELSEGGEA